jgi:hypothetical protein
MLLGMTPRVPLASKAFGIGLALTLLAGTQDADASTARRVKVTTTTAAPAPTSSTLAPTTPTTAATVSTSTTQATTTTMAPVTQGPARFFPSTSFWNRSAAAAVIDPGSAAYVTELQRMLATNGTYLNSSAWSTPVYRVGAGQPKVTVICDGCASDLTAAFASVPLPANAKPASGTDQHLVLMDESTDTMWEFWQLHIGTDGAWHASYGGRIDGVSTFSGVFSGTRLWWGATATGLALAGGLITKRDLDQGFIDHALALALPVTAKATIRPPAVRTDGQSLDLSAIPQGTWFRLDPTVNVDALAITPLSKMIAKAAQTYGMYVRDTAGTVALYGEDLTRFGADPFRAALGGDPSVELQRLPWDRMQALTPPG